MRLQLADVCDPRRVLAVAFAILSLSSHGVVSAAPKTAQKSKKAGSKEDYRAVGKTRVKPETVYLEEVEEEEPSLQAVSDQDEKSAASDRGEPDGKEGDGARKNGGGGPTLSGSLETTAYADTDAVSVLSPVAAVSAADDVNGWSVGGSYLIDVVTAASVDIVSTASPAWTEVRHVGALNGSMKWDPATLGVSGVVSREPDYVALTAGVSASVDLMEKNVTPYLAVSGEKDSIGRTGLPHAYWKDKRVTSVQLGVTLVLGRATITSVQWDGSFERGYLGKPYRYVPLFAPGQGGSIPVGASIDEVNRRRLSLRAIEQLPASRDRHALSGHFAHRLERSTIRLDERLYADDWKLLASTTEVRYFVALGKRLELWPHLRYHVQGAVGFWKRAYEALPGPGGLVAPTLRTGDRELGPLQTLVLGAGARWTLVDGSSGHWVAVLECDAGHTTFSDTLYIRSRNMGYSTLAVEAEF
jgi:hypothetical protein